MNLDVLLRHVKVSSAQFAPCKIDFGCCLLVSEGRPATFHTVLQGEGTLSYPGGKIPFGARSGLLVPGNMVHTLVAGPADKRVSGPPEGKLSLDPSAERITVTGAESAKESMEVLCSHIRATVGAGIGLFDGLQQPLVIDFDSDPALAGSLDRLIQENRDALPGSEIIVSALTSVLLTDIVRHLSATSSSHNLWWSQTNAAELAPALGQLLSEPGTNWTLAGLAQVSHMSRTTFLEKFKEHIGTTPMVFLHHIRLNKAAELLETTGRPIDWVATEAGFGDRSNFSRAFRKFFSVSPSEYRISRKALQP